MVALVWFIGGVVLAAAEVVSGELFLLMLGLAALGTAGVTALTDLPLWADALVFAGLSAGLLLGVRRPLSRRFSTAPQLTTGTAALVGRHALVVEAVNEHGGRISLGGDVWTARSLDAHEHYAAGTTVTVMNIDGATAVVWKGI